MRASNDDLSVRAWFLFRGEHQVLGRDLVNDRARRIPDGDGDTEVQIAPLSIGPLDNDTLGAWHDVLPDIRFDLWQGPRYPFDDSHLRIEQ